MAFIAVSLNCISTLSIVCSTVESRSALKRQLDEVPVNKNDRGFMKYAKFGLGHVYAEFVFCKSTNKEALTLDEGRKAVETLASDLFGIPLYTRPPALRAHCPTCETTATFTRDHVESIFAPPVPQINVNDLIRETRKAVEQIKSQRVLSLEEYLFGSDNSDDDDVK